MPSSTGAAAALAWLRGQPHRPTSSAEALSLYVHALLLTHGFRPADADAAATTLPQHLPSAWGTAGYGGRYRHSRSSLTFDITATVVGARLVVHAAAVEDDAQLHTAQLRVAEHVNDAVDFTQQTDTPPNWDNVFTRPEDVATIVQVQIAHRLVPDAAKEGYEAAAAATQRSGAASAGPAGGAGASMPPPPHPPPRIDPLRDHDPLRIGRPQRPGYLQPRVPAGFGSDDLLAPGLPRGPGFGEPTGMGGGNLMGPRNFPGGPTPGRGWPRPEGVPPGARYDPYMPFGPDNDMERRPGFEDEHQLGRGMGRGRGGGGIGGGDRGGGGMGGVGRGGSGGGEEGPPPGMYW